MERFTQIRLNEDMHVHSTFSDGRNSLEENLGSAMLQKLRALCCVERVNKDTPWVADFIRSVRLLKAPKSLTVYAGVEASFADAHGTLDMPPDVDGLDHLFVGDRRFPWEDHTVHPKQVQQWLESGTISKEEALGALFDAMHAAVDSHDRLVFAHLFDILPRIGLSENQVPMDAVEKFAEHARDKGVSVEVSERDRCPSLRVVKTLSRVGVRLMASSNSRRASTVGRYDYVAEIAEGLS